MPKATLPTTPKGWIIALMASFVGFVAGFVTLQSLERWWG